MLSSLTIISIFTEIFIAGILVAGAVTFFRKHGESESRKDAFLGFILVFFAVRIILIIVSQMAFNFGRPLSELIVINRFISLTTLGIIFLIWLFLLVKFKNTKVRSIGGLITRLTGDIPKPGSEFEISGAKLKVLKSDRRGVQLVQLSIKRINSGSFES